MHDIDQVALEQAPGPPAYELEDEEFLEFAGEHEHEDETGELEDESYEHEDETYEHEHETGELEDEQAEGAEYELASDFLEVGTDRELEQFIGDLVRSAAGAASDFTRSREGRQIG